MTVFLTYWLQFVEIDVVDGSQMSWQFVQDSPRCRIPNVDETIGRACGHHGAVRRPRAVDQVLLKVVHVAYK